MTAYPPLDVLKPIDDAIWIVDSGPLHVAGMIPLPVRMTVIRLQDGGILLHSPTRYDAALHKSLKEIGSIRHIIAPNSAHWTFVKEWMTYSPTALAWAAPGLRQRRQVRKANILWHDDLGSSSGALWAPEIEQTEVAGIGGFREVCFFHRSSGSLIVTDIIQHLETRKMSPFMRLFATLVGARKRAPIYLRAIVKLKGEPARIAARRMMELEPKRIILSHGAVIDRDVPAKLREALDWLL
jgi:hypothetical protein